MDAARLFCVGESLPFQSPTLKRSSPFSLSSAAGGQFAQFSLTLLLRRPHHGFQVLLICCLRLSPMSWGTSTGSVNMSPGYAFIRGRCGHATARSRPRLARPSEPRIRAEPRPRSHEPPAYAAQPGLRFSPEPQPPQPAET
ncbi:unnamed protein product [Rangifer tarandus platyrhynchus]|uniref:Uncharacterized protein n=1 Tax=Rangifer tarandus platyrhynchus TaxID=3082113 RepID=A0ABN8YQH2_RANTA|nr:unnamed protein product [Rangifer tarandus platyrhynchus]